jgi:hypothetical protein
MQLYLSTEPAFGNVEYKIQHNWKPQTLFYQNEKVWRVAISFQPNYYREWKFPATPQ